METRWHGTGKSILPNMSSRNLMEHGYQGLVPELKVKYVLNGIKCDKLSTAVATAKVQQDEYKKDFDVVVTFLSQDIKKKTQHLV